MNAYFAIVSPTDDFLMFEAELFKPEYYTKVDITKGLHQFVTYGALDMVDLLAPKTTVPYLKTVDAYGNWLVSAYLTPANVRFLLYHDVRAEDSIKAFFVECFDAYAKIISNPFYTPWERLHSKCFEETVRKAYKKHLQ